MNEQRHVAKNTSFALAGEIGQFVLMTLYFILVSQYLDNDEMGVFSFATSIVGLFFVVLDLGMSTLVIREIARDRESAKVLLPRMMSIKLLIGFLILVGLWIFSSVGSSPQGTKTAVKLMSGMLIIGPLSTTYVILFKAAENMKAYATAQIVNRGVMLLVIPVVILMDAGVNGAIMSHLIGSAAVFVLMFFLLKKDYGLLPSLSFNTSGWKQLIIASIPFMTMNLLWEVYTRIDQIIIPYLSTLEANGNYAIAYKYAFITLAIPMAFSSAFYPYFVRKAGTTNEAIRKSSAELYRYLGIISLAVAVFVGIPSLQWITLLSGEKYGAAAPTLTLLVSGMPIIYMQSIHVPILYSFNKQNSVLAATFICIFLDVILDILLIPVWGIIGAAAATIACNVFIFAYNYTTARRVVGSLPFFSIMAKPFLCALISGAALFWLSGILPDGAPGSFWSSNFAFLAPVTACFILYCALLALFRCITRSDFDLFKSVFSKN